MTVSVATPRYFGWKRQPRDPRDWRFAMSTPPGILPKYIDLRPAMPRIYDQGQVNSCVGNSVAAAIHYDRMRQQLVAPQSIPSRLMIYYLAREIEGTVESDEGCYIRDAIKAVAKFGAALESGADSWPYDTKRVAERPGKQVFQAALSDLATEYYALPADLAHLRACLAGGFPICFGAELFPEFDSDAVAASGRVPLPASGATPIGGHAMVLCGYDDRDRNFLVRNSWGPAWGLKGYALFPYDYVTNPNWSSDFWTIRQVSKR